MLFLKLILTIVSVTFITFIYRYFKAKTNYQNMRNIRLDFEEWFFDKSNNQRCRPNQEVFKRLYEEVYGEKTRALAYFSYNKAWIKQQQVDVVASFPTKDLQIASQIFPIMQNMEDYFKVEFDTVKRPMYWLKFIIFLPQEIMQYLGIKPKLFVTHFLNFLIWFAGIVISIFGSDIRNLIVSLFK